MIGLKFWDVVNKDCCFFIWVLRGYCIKFLNDDFYVILLRWIGILYISMFEMYKLNFNNF